MPFSRVIGENSRINFSVYFHQLVGPTGGRIDRHANVTRIAYI